MQVFNIKNFEDFLALGTRDWHPIHTWIYRGVPDATFGLRPVIGRDPPIHKGKVDTFRLLNDERLLLEDFKRQAATYTTLAPVHDIDWLSLARHHGLATRLLDWTYNPLIALFFAAYPEHSTDYAVYRYWSNTRPVNLPKLSLEQLQRRRESDVFDPRFTIERFVRQSSVLLLCHRPWVDYDDPHSERNISKIIFPASTRNRVRHHLLVLGINPTFVRPDLDGLCQCINDRHLYRKKFWFPLPKDKTIPKRRAKGRPRKK